MNETAVNCLSLQILFIIFATLKLIIMNTTATKGTKFIFFSLLFSFWAINLFAQDSDRQTIKSVLSRDSLFWLAYNTCDTARIGDFYADDVEFYHDKNGFSKGRGSIVSSFKANLCSDNFRLRREALDSTIHVFLLKNNDSVYGAIITGEHFFYVLEKDKKERLDGWAKFTHTWMLQNGKWEMTRILSYDHKPAPYLNKRKVAKIPTKTLDTYIGQYNGPSTNVLVKRENENLIQIVNGKRFTMYPETATLFFLKERDLTFEFLGKNKTDRKMVVRQNDEIVEELTLTK
jgi:hypothetical protein